jgi:single-stranded-DNA-specific exonuclease
MKKKWIEPKPITPEVDQVLSEFPKPIRQLLFSRGILSEESATIFLNAEAKIEDPFAIKNMEVVVQRLHDAIVGKENVAIYGDYDVDGVTATAMMVEVINQSGGLAEGYIPNRFEEGYGLNNEALDALKEKGVKLVVTVDCGIRSPVEAQHASEIGLDLIITDHHHPKGDVPKSFAVLCPKQEGDEYPNKELAGVGLAYKVLQGLSMKYPEFNLDPENWLDLVALGTVADVVTLSDENRALVRKGIELIRTGQRIGLRSLANVAEISIDRVNSFDIGFMLAPRLNASGRLESALASLNLLLAKNVKDAGELAQKLDSQNIERQKITREIQKTAELLVQEDGEPYFLFAVHSDFNQGVVGLAASRLVEKYYRPAIVATKGEKHTRGSGRSIPEFHITQALDECADLLVRHGGHAMAAGFTVENEHVEELVKKLKEIAKRVLHDQIEATELKAVLRPDVEIKLVDLRPELLTFLDQFQPTGMGNPEPLFLTKSVKVVEPKKIGKDGSHLKMKVTEDGKLYFDAIAFRFGDQYENIPQRIDLVYAYERNYFNDRVNLQLKVRDMRTAESLN